MKVTYDPQLDTVRILFSNAPITNSSPTVPGLIIDYDVKGSVVGLELAHASYRIHDPRTVEFAEHSSASLTNSTDELHR